MTKFDNEIDTRKLIDKGYIIENMIITSADLVLNDYNCFSLKLSLTGAGVGVDFGNGYAIGKWYANEYCVGSAIGEEAIMCVMNTVGVTKFSDLKGKYCRVAYKYGEVIKLIGNIINNYKWFNLEEHLAEEKEYE